MATVVARMLASLEAETTQFHARMTAAETQLTKWSSATAGGRRATIALNQGIQQLAFQAANIPGPVGKAASAIGALGLGSGPVLLAVAGLGAIATAYKLAAQEAENLKLSTDRLNESYRGIVAGGNPLVQLQNRILLAVQEQGKAQEQLDRLQQTSAFLGKTRGSPGEIALAQNQLDAATRVVNALRQLRPDLVDAARLVVIQFQQGTAALARQMALAGGGRRADFRAGAFGAAGLGLDTGPATFANIRGNVPRFGADPFAPEVFPPREFFLSDVTDELASKKGRQPGFKLTPEFAIMSSMALMQGAQAGGIGGLLGAAAGPAAAINPLAGAIVGGLGGIFTMFDRSEERRHKELVDKLERIANEVGLERVTVVFTGPDGHQVRKSLAELESGDAVERVPGPAGATG